MAVDVTIYPAERVVVTGFLAKAFAGFLQRQSGGRLNLVKPADSLECAGGFLTFIDPDKDEEIRKEVSERCHFGIHVDDPVPKLYCTRGEAIEPKRAPDGNITAAYL